MAMITDGTDGLNGELVARGYRMTAESAVGRELPYPGPIMGVIDIKSTTWGKPCSVRGTDIKLRVGVWPRSGGQELFIEAVWERKLPDMPINAIVRRKYLFGSRTTAGECLRRLVQWFEMDEETVIDLVSQDIP